MIQESLKIGLLFVAIIILITTFLLLRKGKIPIKFTFMWWLPALLLIVVALAPNTLIKIMKLIGFQTLSNMIIGLLITILFFITIALTVIISGQSKKIRLLIQELSLLKSKQEGKSYEEDEDGKL